MPAWLNSRYRILAAITVSLTGLICLLYWTGLYFGDAEANVRDWLTTNGMARRADPHPDIIFLAIDEDSRSLDTVFAEDYEHSSTLRLMKGGFPWNRAVYADIVERLMASGARAVLFDMVFPSERDGDEEFHAALMKYRGRVVIGSSFADNKEIDAAVPSYELPAPSLRPPPDGPSWIGFVNVRADPDGKVRRVSYRTTKQEYAGIPTNGHEEEILSLSARALEGIGLGNLIPQGYRPTMLRFQWALKPHSIHQIFVESQWNAPTMYDGGKLFRNKIVLIGAAGDSSEDRLQTPSGVTLGPQVHLSALNAALQREFRHETSRTTNLGLIVASGFVAWLLGAFVRRPLLRLLFLAVAIFVTWFIMQNVANNTEIVPILLSPILALTASTITWAAWEQIGDRLERQRTRRALERYVGQDVAHEVLDNPATYLNALGGQRKEITILFSDVRGFTTLTEDADAQALVAQLNEYFEVMVEIVFEHHGTLDKFIGDAVMAHWGSIVTEGPKTDAHRAVSTVLKMQTALTKLNEGWRGRGIKEMRVGFGVNSGDAIVGNLGCEAKMEVSVIGDAVNLSSRLEGVTKQYHIDICVGESVAVLVRDSFVIRSVDLIVVKGKTRPVEIFTVLGERNGADPAWMPQHDEAMQHYRAGRFAEAEAKWREVLTQIPGDGLTEVMLERCALLQREPPAGEWTGVYEMKSK